MKKNRAVLMFLSIGTLTKISDGGILKSSITMEL